MVPVFPTRRESTMLKLNELFSGIGAQSAALKRLGIDFEVVATADTDKDALVSYAALNCEIPTEYEYPAATCMADYLAERNIGYDFDKKKPYDWHRLISKKTGKASERLKKYYLACVISKNRGDVSKIEKLEYADLWTYSFPCQDISVAGKQAGIEKHTRSGLLYEVERLLNVSAEHRELPKHLMLENVKNLVGKKFKAQFEEWLQTLDELGYNTYWQVLNAKNYGIPQNRERVFGISIRKDIDMGYVFPEPFELKIRLKDILEDEVDKKYYINNEKANKLIQKLSDTNQLTDVINPCDGTINEPKVKDISNCIKARYDAGVSNQKPDGTMVVEKNELDVAFSLRGCGMPWDKRYEAICRVYNPIGISPTVTAGGGGGIEPKALIPQATKQGYIECNIPGVADLSFPDSKTRRGRVQDGGEICPTLMAGQQDICYIDTPCIAASRGRNPNNPSDRTVGSPTEQRLEINQNGTSNMITTVQKDNYVVEPRAVKLQNSNMKGRRIKDPGEPMFTVTAHDRNAVTLSEQTNNFRIRKLTPKECWRLMGFTDEQFQKAQDAGISNSQLYKQAGNSIVVDVLEYIFRNLLK